MLTLWRILIHLGCASPLAWLYWAVFVSESSSLGADPVKEIEHFLGFTALLIFCLMFLLGIFLQLIGKNQYQILRRPLGLWAFVWAVAHLLSYLFLELGGELGLFSQELFRRPYLIFGGLAWLILFIMSLTSLPRLKQWIGKRWFFLYQLAYPALAMAMLHYLWSVKSLTLPPILLGGCVLLIFCWKGLSHIKSRSKSV